MRSLEEQDFCGDEGFEAVVSAVARAAEPMPAESREAVRERLMASVKPAAVPLRVRVLRPAIALATAGAMLGGVSYAAAQSSPGEPLFGLKQSIVSTVRSAEDVLARNIDRRRVPAVLKPLEAPAPARMRPPRVNEAAPTTPDAGKTPQTGQDKVKGKGGGNGNGKSSTPKSRGNGSDGQHKRQVRKTNR